MQGHQDAAAESEKGCGEKRIGLALGAGAARGLAHIGVLQVLERKGIRPQMITGTSMGAFIGALYAKDPDADRLEQYAMRWSRWKTVQLLDLVLPRSGLLRGRRVENILDSLLGKATFSDLKMPFACVAADIETGEEVVFREGLVEKAVRASISIPGIFEPVDGDQKLLVDGGLVNPVPVSVAKEMGANLVIAVNVIPDLTEKIREHIEEHRPVNIFEVLTLSLYVCSQPVLKDSLAGADIVIEPDVAHIGAADFHRAAECIFKGVKAAETALSKLKP